MVPLEYLLNLILYTVIEVSFFNGAKKYPIQNKKFVIICTHKWIFFFK